MVLVQALRARFRCCKDGGWRARAMEDKTQSKELPGYADKELLYAATARCRCGAGLAYPLSAVEALRCAAWVKP